MLCGIAPFRFVLIRFVLLPVHLHLAVCLGRNMFFSSQPMGSARSFSENATLRVELQDNSYFKEGAPGKSVSSASGKEKSFFLIQNHGSVRLMGLDSRGFLPLTCKLPQIVVQRGSPHDLSRSVQNELDFACFCEVLGRRTKRSVPVP